MVLPPPSSRKYWTRRGIAEWLVERLSEDPPTLVGIDHASVFPLRYSEAHHARANRLTGPPGRRPRTICPQLPLGRGPQRVRQQTEQRDLAFQGFEGDRNSLRRIQP